MRLLISPVIRAFSPFFFLVDKSLSQRSYLDGKVTFKVKELLNVVIIFRVLNHPYKSFTKYGILFFLSGEHQMSYMVFLFTNIIVQHFIVVPEIRIKSLFIEENSMQTLSILFIKYSFTLSFPFIKPFYTCVIAFSLGSNSCFTMTLPSILTLLMLYSLRSWE